MTSELFFESIQKQYNNQLPFVVYRKPNTSEVKALLQANDKIHYVKNHDESGFVFAPFDDSEDSILIPLEYSNYIEITYSDNEAYISVNKEFKFNEKDKKNHIQLVEKGIKAIEKDKFEKVVLSRQETVNITNFNLINIFKNLLRNYQLAFVYCWYHPKIGLWLGATPET
jgi:isochorismate synthase